jgi:hypothetical protein
MITDTIGVKLKPLSILKIAASNNMSESDSIRMVIDYIFDDKDIYKVDDVDDNELEEFIDSMGIDAIKYIMDWIGNVGSLELDKDWICPKCNGKNNLHIGGVGDFFV